MDSPAVQRTIWLLVNRGAGLRRSVAKPAYHPSDDRLVAGDPGPRTPRPQRGTRADGKRFPAGGEQGMPLFSAHFAEIGAAILRMNVVAAGGGGWYAGAGLTA